MGTATDLATCVIKDDPELGLLKSALRNNKRTRFTNKMIESLSGYLTQCPADFGTKQLLSTLQIESFVDVKP